MSKFYLPGYYWYLDGEKDLSQLSPSRREHIFGVCQHVMNNFSVRIFGFHEFSRYVLQLLESKEFVHANLDRDKYLPYIIWYYNRALLIQLTQKPIQVKQRQYVSVPMQRSPAKELQLDILKLSQYFREVNYEIGYFVVIVDVYSRYVWAAPVSNLTVKKVSAAIFQAFSRTSLPKTYFEKIHDQIRKITVDGGSEFKGEFPAIMKQIFPNASVIVAPPKNRTFNRPTLTGPIESAIRMLRKILRDFGLKFQTDILGSSFSELEGTQHGVDSILTAYNGMKRAELKNYSPTDIATNIVRGGAIATKQLEDVTVRMATKRAEQITKKRKMELEDFPIITSKTQGYGYRLIVHQGAFPKEVDFRVTYDMYYIDTYTSTTVNLIHWEDSSKTKETSWQSLVLVKTPIILPPNDKQVEKFFKQEEERNTFKAVPKDYMRPYEISPTIVNAMEASKSKDVLHVETGNQPTRVSSRINKGVRGERFTFS